MTGTVTEAQTEATVVDANGQQIATVVQVEDGVPYVEPRDQVDTTARRALGWRRGSPPHRLTLTHVASVDEDVIHLKANL